MVVEYGFGIVLGSRVFWVVVRVGGSFVGFCVLAASFVAPVSLEGKIVFMTFSMGVAMRPQLLVFWKISVKRFRLVLSAWEKCVNLWKRTSATRSNLSYPSLVSPHSTRMSSAKRESAFAKNSMSSVFLSSKFRILLWR